MTLQLKIDYPETLPDVLQETREQFEIKRLSSGTAASLVGMERASFLFQLHRFGVAMIDLTEEELRSDIENA